MVDEDPGSVPHLYEKELTFNQELNGIKYLVDEKRNNKILVLKVKLEDWLISACRKSEINIVQYGLPLKPNDLHDVINNRMHAYEKLLDALLKNGNESIAQLSKWLN